jgi:hypothetical protein
MRDARFVATYRVVVEFNNCFKARPEPGRALNSTPPAISVRRDRA